MRIVRIFLAAVLAVGVPTLMISSPATASPCASFGVIEGCAGSAHDLSISGTETVPGEEPAGPDLAQLPSVDEIDTSLTQPQLDPETLAQLELEAARHQLDCNYAETDGDEEFYEANCVEDDPTDQDQPEPASEPPPVTPDIVRRQLEAIQLPPGEISHQPTGRALVNKEVIFYCENPRTDTYDLQILGRSVRANIHVESYHWDWGDGQTLTTDKPGAPYPSFDVNHIYEDTGTYTVTLVLDYTATFQIASGPTITVPGVVSAPPASLDLRIVSATTVLVAPDD